MIVLRIPTGPEAFFWNKGNLYRMADKIFKTYVEQLGILKERGIDLPADSNNEKESIDILQKNNYYSVVNGYKDPFLVSSSQETFRPGTTLKDLYFLFEFDCAIRMTYLKFILEIEHQVKSVIAYEFSKLYGYKDYLKNDILPKCW